MSLYLRIFSGFSGERDPLAPRETIFQNLTEMERARSRGIVKGTGYVYAPASANRAESLEAVEDTARMIVEGFRALAAIEPEEAEAVLHQLAETLDAETPDPATADADSA